MKLPLLSIGLTLLLVGCSQKVQNAAGPQPDSVCIRWEEKTYLLVCPSDSELSRFWGNDNALAILSDYRCFAASEGNLMADGDCIQDITDGQSLCYNPRIDKVLRRDCEEWSYSPRP